MCAGIFASAVFLCLGLRDDNPWTQQQQFPDAAARTEGLADESTCAACHEQASQFHLTGHANTLREAKNPDSLRMLRQLLTTTAAIDEGISLEERDDQVHMISSREGVHRKAELEWCFGSGAHACTWTTSLSDSQGNTDVLEFRWTWFSEINGFGLTPGQPSEAGNSAVSAFGLLFDGPKGRKCFFCHGTSVPLNDGHLDETNLRPGVTCQRCHGPRAEHVRTEGQSKPSEWSIVTRDDEISLCAVCHRFSEERDPHEIYPGNPAIVRFQPMGLLESKCYQKSEMRCTTCHDPHQPVSPATSRDIGQCLQCHSSSIEAHVVCGAGETDACFDCHMPRVESAFPVHFTDHWIRVPSSESGVSE